MKAQCLISIVDDDLSVRESLPELLKELGFDARTFSSAGEFLASDAPLRSRCLILDIGMPVMSGPELFHELRRRKLTIPVIFITARKDKVVQARLLGEGAVDCLFKPFSDAALLQALNKAVGDKSTF